MSISQVMSDLMCDSDIINLYRLVDHVTHRISIIIRATHSTRNREIQYVTILLHCTLSRLYTAQTRTE